MHMILRALLYFLLLSFWYIQFLPVQAAGGSSDFTSTEFTIETSKISPLKVSGDPTNSDDAALWILNKLSYLLLMLIPIIAGISGVIAWYFFVFSGWDSEKIHKAKNIISINIVAILIALLSYSIINAVVWALSF